jgi:hypothetical protein
MMRQARLPPALPNLCLACECDRWEELELQKHAGKPHQGRAKGDRQYMKLKAKGPQSHKGLTSFFLSFSHLVFSRLYPLMLDLDTCAGHTPHYGLW